MVTQISMHGCQIKRVSEFRLLGISFNNWLTWYGQVGYTCQKASTRLYFLTLMKRTGYSPNDITEIIHPLFDQFWNMLSLTVIIWMPLGKQVWNLLSKGTKVNVSHFFKEIEHPEYKLHHVFQ